MINESNQPIDVSQFAKAIASSAISFADAREAFGKLSYNPCDPSSLVADHPEWTQWNDGVCCHDIRPGRRLRCEYCGCLSKKDYGTCEHCGAPL